MSKREFIAWYIGLGLLFTVPFWLVVHPPAQDLPANLGLAAVVSTLGTANDPFAPYYVVSWTPAPNTLYYLVVGTLGRILPLWFLSKLFLSLAVLATPAAMAYARKADQKDIAGALFGFAFALSYSLIAGFISFALALPMMIFVTGLARRQGDDPTWRRAAIITLCMMLTYLIHAHVFLYTVGTVGLVGLCCIRRPAWRRRLILTIGPVFASMLIAAPWYVKNLRSMDREGGLRAHFHSISDNIEYLQIHTFDQLRSSWDVYAGYAISLAVIALILVSYFPRAKRPRDGSWFKRHGYLLCALASLILYFGLPSSVRYQQVINGRQAIVTLMMLAIAVHLDWHRRLVRYAVYAALAAVIGYGALYAQATVGTRAEVDGLERLMDRMGKHNKLIAPYMPRSKVYRMDIYRHVGAYNMAWNEGLIANVFGASNPILSIRTRRSYRPPSFKRRIGYYDYVLSGRPIKRRELRLVDRAGLFYLYRVAP